MNTENPESPHPGLSGFVLVEILVVSLIVAILAAVAIPMYSGYIRNQKRSAALSMAQTAAITASSIKRRTGTPPDSESLNAAIVLPNDYQFTVTVNEAGDQVIVTERSDPGDPISDSARF